jgi:ATP-dependent exoDNAse (exonuclease V) beta subunit
VSEAVASRFGPIFDPTRSVVLVASAGTGKTWRLVRRYLRIIATVDPRTGAAWARPEQVVAVTFTRAAAAQMQARVFAALTAAPDDVGDDDPVLAEVAAEATHAARLALAEHVAAAPIGTLHSLCARMIGEFPELSGVPPDARPLEPAEQLLELEAFVSGWLDRIIDDAHHRAHAGCVELLRAHPLGFVRRELRAMVDDPEGLGGRPVGRECDGLGGRPVGRECEGLQSRWLDAEAIAAARDRFVRAQWRGYVEHLQMPLSLVSQACAHELRHGRATPKLAELSERIARLQRRHIPEPELASVVADVQELMSQRPSNELGSVAAMLVQLRNHHKVISTRRERPVLPDPRSCLQLEAAQHLSRWIALATAAREDWAASLQQRAVLRYDDLELLARRLLDDPRAQAHLRGRYRHVLVDEYQDINPIQAQIIERLVALCGPDEGGAKLFFVGDPKQSIYRFRGADPEVFQRAVHEHGGEVVMLADNRRSSPTLARFFMQLFPPLFAGVLPWANVTDLGRPAELARLRDIQDHAVVPWDGPIVPTRAHDRLPGLAVDLLLRDRGQPIELEIGPEIGPESGDETLRDEAARVAVHLRGLLDGATELENLEAREIAILVPRWNLAEDYRAALETWGIAADLAGGRGLLLLPEVRDLINLVRLWADEHDELAALAVLRGPCFACSDLGIYVLARWPGVDRRVREADPDLPEFADLDEVWEPWDDEDPSSSQWPRASARRMREVLRHGRLDPERAIAALERAGRILVRDGETPAAVRQRLLEQLHADAAALEAGRERCLARMREAGARSTAELLADMIADFRLEAHWLLGPRGRRAVADAWRFVEHVRTLEPEGPDLQRLSTWLDAGVEPAPEGSISPQADAVTITTWHGAKGKEWPVVVVAGLGEFRQQGARTSWSGAAIPALRAEQGERVAVPRISGPHHGFVPEADPLHEPCTNMLAPLEAAEAKRLLYVAMTRARDRLVLSGEADLRAHVSYDDKPYLGLDWGFDMKPLIGEPKPAYLCKRPIELLVAALDLPAARPGAAVIRPRAATWSLAHVRVIDDAMLRAGLERGTPVLAPKPELVLAPAQKPVLAPAPAPKPGRKRAKAASNQLSFGALFGDAEPLPEPEPRSQDDALLRWRAGAAMQRWNPSAGRSPWPISGLAWDMPLPARRPALLEDEDPRRLGELFHRAMERWNFEGEPPRSRELEPLVAISYGEREPADRRRIGAWLLRCLELVGEEPELLAELSDARTRDELFHEVDVEALVPEHEREHWIGGRIDLLWRDASGRWNVLDYKVTAKVRSRAQMQELEWEYGPQLLLYQKALSRWRPQGQPAELGRFGLWLAPAGKPMWLRA